MLFKLITMYIKQLLDYIGYNQELQPPQNNDASTNIGEESAPMTIKVRFNDGMEVMFHVYDGIIEEYVKLRMFFHASHDYPYLVQYIDKEFEYEIC